MNRWIKFNDRYSYEMGVYISGEGSFAAPERDTEVITIPGKNGKLTLDNGRYENVLIKYPALMTCFKINRNKVAEWLLSNPAYLRLEDSYHIGEYRMARYSGGLNPEMWELNRCAEVELEFDCWPQRFLIEGDNARYILKGSPMDLRNPTEFTAKPDILLHGSGSGSITIGPYTVLIGEMPAGGSLWLNCEQQTASYGLVSYASEITLAQGEFPSLHPGESQCSCTGGITSMEIYPRWWRL